MSDTLNGSGIGNNLTSLYLTNPNLAGALRRQQLAQALSQEGTSTAPASPYQALARVAQSALGAALTNTTNSQISDAADKMNADRQAWFGGGQPSPLAGAMTGPPPQAPQAQGGVSPQPVAANQPSTLDPIISQEADKAGIPQPLAHALFAQESGKGAASPNVGQVLGSTAANPGYGMAPLSPDQINNAPANVAFSLDYFKRKAAANGITDFNDPTQVAAALKLYNGGGDPNYVQHVMARLPGGGAPTVANANAQNGQPTQVAQGGQQPASFTGQANAQPSDLTGQVNNGQPDPMAAYNYHMRRAQLAASSPDPLIRGQAQIEEQMAQRYLTVGKFQDSTFNGVPVQRDLVTNEVKNPVSGTGRPFDLPDGSKGVVLPGGEIKIIAPPNNAGVAAKAAAAAQGSATGTQAAATLPQMVKIGTAAAQNIGTVDSAVAQLNAAQQHGIPSGYFTPALATAAAAAKNLGIDTSKLGVDPAAVGDIQDARKSLAITAGGILQNIIGPDAQITEGKIEHFIHATPGIEMDPQAIQKILGWARSQFVFNHDMAMDAMSHADPQTGMIPPGWQAQYYRGKGSFGPIYNPLANEMQQPAGEGPSQQGPQIQAPAAPTQPAAAQTAPAATYPKVGSIAEAQKLPKGSMFYDPNGQLRRVP